MASKPLSRCNQPGCGALTREGRCEKHKKKQQRDYNKSRPSSAARGYDHKWRKFRKAFLQDNPLCVHCKERGVIRAANVVDHVIPHRDNPELFWNNEFQSLCKPCHSSKTRKE